MLQCSTLYLRRAAGASPAVPGVPVDKRRSNGHAGGNQGLGAPCRLLDVSLRVSWSWAAVCC